MTRLVPAQARRVRRNRGRRAARPVKGRAARVSGRFPVQALAVKSSVRGLFAAVVADARHPGGYRGESAERAHRERLSA